MMEACIAEYDFSHKYRGQALIFIQERFDDEGFSKRYGAKKDLRKMKMLFDSLDFKVKVYLDLTTAKIMDKLKKDAELCTLPELVMGVSIICPVHDGHKKTAAASKYNKVSDCLACVFSTHGSEEEEIHKKHGYVTWKNCIYGKDCQLLYVDDILDMFNSKNCPDLQDKPKLFFIQACRSRHGNDLLYDDGNYVTIVRPQWRNTNQDGRRDSEDDVDREKQTTSRQPADGDGSHGNHGGTRQIEAAMGQLTLADAGNGAEYEQIGDYVDIYEDWIEDEDDDILKEIPLYNEEEEEEPETEEVDPRASGDTGSIPPAPVELTPINCPNDFLVVYPVMPGRAAFRSTIGSWLLYYIYQHRWRMMNAENLLQILTSVCGMAAKRNHKLARSSELKSATHTLHCLSGAICFRPKEPRSFMSQILEYIRKKFRSEQTIVH